MKKQIFLSVAIAALGLSLEANAQTNLQTFYDFERGHVTTTLEGFHADSWGNTFFFVDYDYNFRDGNNKVVSPSSTYFEIARCFNFWQNSSLGALSLQLEYNGGFGTFGPVGLSGSFPVNSAYLVGVDYFLHSADYSNTFNFKLLYKQFVGAKSNVPLQFTTVWGMKNVLGLQGLTFSGFLDVWCEGDKVVALSEPQLWYNVGGHFGVENLNIGGEVEFAYNFAGQEGFFVRPCLGFKWVF